MKTINKNISLEELSKGVNLSSKKIQKNTKAKRINGKFVLGPIPWNWLCKAASISGSAAKLSLALWHLDGFKQSRTVKLSNKILEELSVDRLTKYKVLKQMEDAGLITVKRQRGSSPEITILDID